MRSYLGNLRRMQVCGIAFGASVALAGAVDVKSAGTGEVSAMTAAELVPTLHAINQMEMRAGRTAQARGGSEAVRRYGATLIRDHEAADKYLKQYAAEEKVDVNGKLRPRVEAALQHAESELANLSTVGGQAFDQEFASMMLLDHESAIGFVDRATPNITDPKLKALLGEVEPNLREHKQIAANILNGFTGPSVATAGHCGTAQGGGAGTR